MRIKDLFFVVMLFNFCGTPSSRTEEVETEQKDMLGQTPIFNVDSLEDFNSFLKHWNTDSSFQLSRIKFPLEQDIYDPHEGGEAQLIYQNSTDWTMYVNLEYKNEYYDGYELEFNQDTI